MAFCATYKIAQPIQPIWQHIFALSWSALKSHRENSISSIFLESPHQVDMKNVVKSSKHFLGISILQKLTCAAPSVVQGPKQSLRQQFQQQLFSLFQLETKTIFTNNVGHYGLQSQNNFWILFHNPSPPSAILNNFVIL